MATAKDKSVAAKDAEALNPKIRELEIGIRERRVITLYPLSIASELKITDLITSILVAYSMAQEGADDNVGTLQLFVDLFKKNLPQIIEAVTCEEKAGEEIAGEMDNEQFLDFVDILIEVNFEGAAKKGPKLAGRLKGLFGLPETPAEQSGSKMSLPTSSKDTDSMTSPTSTVEHSEKAA